MFRISVQSRTGNLALVILGAVYAFSALAVLAWFLIDVRNAEALLDRLMQIGLVGAAIIGIWFLVGALENLGVHVSRRAH